MEWIVMAKQHHIVWVLAGFSGRAVFGFGLRGCQTIQGRTEMTNKEAFRKAYKYKSRRKSTAWKR
jgi:hypothetical protein